MNVVWGLVVTVLALLCWGGQTISWFAPGLATRLSLTERESEVEPAYWADIRGEAAWDVVSLWTMVVAGVLLIADSSAWAYFGLIGGGSYAYFAGRGIATRAALLRRGLRIGTPENVRAAFVFLTIWLAMAVVTIVAAVGELRGG